MWSESIQYPTWASVVILLHKALKLAKSKSSKLIMYASDTWFYVVGTLDPESRGEAKKKEGTLKGKEEGGAPPWGRRRGRSEEERDPKEMDEEEDEEPKILFPLPPPGLKLKTDLSPCCIPRSKSPEIGSKISNNQKKEQRNDRRRNSSQRRSIRDSKRINGKRSAFVCVVSLSLLVEEEIEMRRRRRSREGDTISSLYYRLIPFFFPYRTI